jgi:hypothetical protein
MEMGLIYCPLQFSAGQEIPLSNLDHGGALALAARMIRNMIDRPDIF